MEYISLLLPALVAAVASFGLGMLWYGPLLGKEWAALAKIKSTEPNPKLFAVAYVRQAITACVLVFLFAGLNPLSALVTTAILWLGFTAMPALSDVLWMKRPLGLYVINIGYELMSVLLMVVIVTSWL